MNRGDDVVLGEDLPGDRGDREPPMSEPVTTHEPRKLGSGARLLVGLLVAVTAVLVVLGALALCARRAETINQEKRAKTLTKLEEQRGTLGPGKDLFRPPPHSESRGDPTGQQAVRDAFGRSRSYFGWKRNDVERREARIAEFREFWKECVRDGWDHPIYYRCPGPIHRNGWDLISCGPNGVYEEGGGDDIVVGQDLPNGIAAIESGR